PELSETETGRTPQTAGYRAAVKKEKDHHAGHANSGTFAPRLSRQNESRPGRGERDRGISEKRGRTTAGGCPRSAREENGLCHRCARYAVDQRNSACVCKMREIQAGRLRERSSRQGQ